MLLITKRAQVARGAPQDRHVSWSSYSYDSHAFRWLDDCVQNSLSLSFSPSFSFSLFLSLSLSLFQHWYDENKLPCIYKNKDLLVSLFPYGNATNNIMKLEILYLTVIILVAFPFWDFLAISINFLKFLYGDATNN